MAGQAAVCHRVALFKSEQFGLAEFDGVFPDGKSYYTGLDTFVSGL